MESTKGYSLRYMPKVLVFEINVQKQMFEI